MLARLNPVSPYKVAGGIALGSVGLGIAWAAWARHRSKLDLVVFPAMMAELTPPGATEGASGAVAPCAPPGPCVRTGKAKSGGGSDTAPPAMHAWLWQDKSWLYEGQSKLWTSKSDNQLPDMPVIPVPGIPWLGPLVSTSLNALKGFIKKKKNYAAGSPGRGEKVTQISADGVRIQAQLDWGLDSVDWKSGPSSPFPCWRWEWDVSAVATGTLPTTTGDPISLMPPMGGAGKPAHNEYGACGYGASGDAALWMPFKYRTWVPAVGPQLPELGVVIEGGQTNLILWMPGRVGPWFYNLKYRIKPL